MIEFDDMIVDIVSNEKLQHIVTELFVRGKKLNIYFVLITQSYLTVPKNIRLNSIRYHIMNILNKWELQNIANNHSSNTEFGDFMNLYKKIYRKTILLFSEW